MLKWMLGSRKANHPRMTTRRDEYMIWCSKVYQIGPLLFNVLLKQQPFGKEKTEAFGFIFIIPFPPVHHPTLHRDLIYKNRDSITMLRHILNWFSKIQVCQSMFICTAFPITLKTVRSSCITQAKKKSPCSYSPYYSPYISSILSQTPWGIKCCDQILHHQIYLILKLPSHFHSPKRGCT